jgi:redox-sensitive bicupin YhaK (pirin superfamily)
MFQQLGPCPSLEYKYETQIHKTTIADKVRMNRREFLNSTISLGVGSLVYANLLPTMLLASTSVKNNERKTKMNNSTINKVIHRANERGYAEHGWLKSFHSFSFANYYNPEMMGFGLLRVINDDSVDPGFGFGTHPHNDMEIISIPLSGTLEHKDSMGNHFLIKAGEVQVMSAGTGITHSEYNQSKTEPVKFLQIWIKPKINGIQPNYDQNSFSVNDRKNQFQVIVSGSGKAHSLKINQDAQMALADLESGNTITYKQAYSGNGIYVFVLKGKINIAGEELSTRDAIGLTNISNVDIQGLDNAEILVIEVPMS